MGADARLVEGLDAQAVVVEVAPLAGRRRTAGAAEHAVDRHQVDQRLAGAQLHQADRLLAPLDAATEHADVEAEHRVEVDDAQHQVVDPADRDHAQAALATAGCARACAVQG